MNSLKLIQVELELDEFTKIHSNSLNRLKFDEFTQIRKKSLSKYNNFSGI